MKVDVALLCDAARVREHLLHILGGGITRVRRPHYPHALGVQLAVRILVHPTELDNEHVLRCLLQSQDGQEIGRVEMTFKLSDAGGEDTLQPGEEHSLAVSLPVDQLPIPKPDSYSFELLIDGIHQTSVPFIAKGEPE